MFPGTRYSQASARSILAAGLAALFVTWGCHPARGGRIRPPESPGRPYLRQVGRVDGKDIWTVNGRYVRDNLDVEYTNFGQHYRFPFIPAGEFWLDRENTPGEERYFIEHLLIENRLMAGGMDYDDALEKADQAERTLRNESRLAREGQSLLRTGRRSDLMRRIHKELLEERAAILTVWVVDGELVRDLYFVDFTEGGHDKVYDFIPPREIWLCDDVVPEEREFILLHEAHERSLMSRGWDYDRAHADSSRLELRYRRRPARLDRKLREEIAGNR